MTSPEFSVTLFTGEGFLAFVYENVRFELIRIRKAGETNVTLVRTLARMNP